MTANHAHTPTTEQVRELYAVDEWGVSHDEYRAEFDRWLAARDERIIAAAEQRGAVKALRDAEKVIDDELQDSPAPNHEEDNYDAGRIDGLTFSQEHLRNRADQMEGDDE